MTDPNTLPAADMTRARNYLTLATAYCRHLGGVRWSDHEDALVYANGRFFAFNEAIAFFVEGLASGGRLIHFAHVIHLIDLVLDARHQNTPAISRIRHLFFGTGGYWRNAGALAGVLCRNIPEVASPPALELVLGRLRDRNYPIRFYAGVFHDTGRSLEQPALSPEEFEDRVLRAAEAYTDDELQSWFQHGRGPVKEAGATIAREQPAPRTLLGTLAALLERPRLAGAETYVTQLVGALALPPRRLAHQELPVGGYADMATQGNFEAILPGQFALEELEFFRRFAERELLFFRREEPPAQNKQELVVLLDQGVRTWGDVRLVLSAAAIALGKQAVRHKTPFYLAATSNGGRLVAPMDTHLEELGRLVEASDLTPNPGLALEGVLEQTSSAIRDIVLLTHPRNVLEPEVRHAALRLGPRDRLFAVALAADGQVEMNELRHGAAVKVRQFRVSFEPAKIPFEIKAATNWSGSVEPIPYPFRFGVDSFITHFDFDYYGHWLVTISREGMLHGWRTDGAGLEILSRAFHDGQVLRNPQALIGVVGGVVVAGSCKRHYIIAHYDLSKRHVRIHSFESEYFGSQTLFYSRGYHAVACMNRSFSGDGLAVDLETGASCSTKKDGPSSRAKQLLEELKAGTLVKRNLPVFANNVPAFGVVLWDKESCSLEIKQDADSWPPFVPMSDGLPILKNVSVPTYYAQKCQGAAAIKIQRQQQPGSVLLLRGPPGVVVAEYPLKGNKFQFQLAQNGAWLARQVGDSNIEVRPVGGAGTVFQTRAGGASHQVRLQLGRRRFLLSVGDSHRHLVSWENAKIETLYERAAARRTQNVLQKWLGQHGTVDASATVPVGAHNYDPGRFVACGETDGLTFLADRFGQVAILDGSGTLVAMFMAFRDRLAAWLPDGAQWGSPALLCGPPTPDALEKIAAVLRQASGTR